MRRYGRLVYSVARSCGLSESDAADITQVTFRLFHESLDRLRPDSRIGQWLATVARRHSWRVYGRNLRETPHDAEALAHRAEALGLGNHDPVGSWELLEWLHHGLGLIDARCRDLLTSLYLQPAVESYHEVAIRIGIPVGSIGPTRARCLQKLRGLLEQGERAGDKRESV
ncbi:hypothetical protein ASA1KI_12890 [Opitutales bacterium ASA1]|nr:hypothetical protein ASA1KI_12890 [Opitutales bacterium ASA1]